MRGFNLAQYEFRTLKAQQLMQQHELGALLLTTETNVRYFTGFLTRFWESQLDLGTSLFLKVENQ